MFTSSVLVALLTSFCCIVDFLLLEYDTPAQDEFELYSTKNRKRSKTNVSGMSVQPECGIKLV